MLKNDIINGACVASAAPTLFLNNNKIEYNFEILKNKEFLTIKETALYLNISEKTLRRMVDG